MGDMLAGQIYLVMAMVAFVGSHLILSHGLRDDLVRQWGADGFRTLYSLVAAISFGLLLVSYHGALHDIAPFQPGNYAAFQAAFGAVMLLAVALFIASLFDNPALAGADISGLSARLPLGVYRITRHPMMAAIALFCLAHLMLFPTVRNTIFFGGLMVFAVGGAKLQDRKKARLKGREWNPWVQRTRFWPDLRRLHELGPVWFVAPVAWLVLTWLESHAMQLPIGLWWFFEIS